MKTHHVPETHKSSLQVLAFLSFALSSLLFNGCQDKQRANPLDPGGSAFQMPSLQFISGPNNGQTIGIDSVEFTWKGNSAENVYVYTLTNLATHDVYYQTTQWNTAASVSFPHLDDSQYDFSLETEYNGIDVDTTYHRTFTIKTLSTPALVFVKKYTLASVGEQFEVYVWIDAVQGLFAGDMTIGFSNASLQLVSVSNGDLPGELGMNQLLTPDYTLPRVVSSANSIGKISVSTAFLVRSNGTNSTITGTGSILKLIFNAVQTGQTQLSFLQISLRDINDNVLNLSQSMSATVNVK